MRGDNGSILSSVDIGTFMWVFLVDTIGVIANNHYRGAVAVSWQKNLFVIDTVTNGFGLYQLDNVNWKRNFTTGTPTRKVPKQVAFGEDSRIVVGGSDHGAVYVFDRKTGSPLHILRHSDNGSVQTVTVRALGNRHNRQSDHPIRRPTRRRRQVPL